MRARAVAALPLAARRLAAVAVSRSVGGQAPETDPRPDPRQAARRRGAAGRVLPIDRRPAAGAAVRCRVPAEVELAVRLGLRALWRLHVLRHWRGALRGAVRADRGGLPAVPG